MGKMVISPGALKGQMAAQNKKWKIKSDMHHISGMVEHMIIIFVTLV